MDIQRACEILEMDVIHIIDPHFVKKQYRRLALQHHPDKNDNSADSNEKFKLINEAYHHIKMVNDRKSTALPNITTYADLLGLFIQSVMTRSNNESFIQIVKDILISCKQLSITTFEGLDKSVVIELYEFMSKYKNVLHVSSDLLAQLKTIVIEKCKNDQVYILNPTLYDLFEGNIYKLVIDTKTYYVPLWHAETYFDGVNGEEIVVRCIPDLPDNISIDENNNICVHTTVSWSKELLTQDTIPIFFYKDRTITLKVSELNISQKQTVVFRREGIYRINESAPYDVASVSDIIVYLHISCIV